jgi:hypothetical protein
VLALVALAYAPTLSFDFVRWDDPLHVYENPLVLRPAEVPALDHLTTPSLGYPTPITVLSYRLEAAVFGLDSPGAFHASNLALHLLACGLAFALGRRIGLGRYGALFAMVVFALHPVSAEPVSWVSGRKDLLALVFSLAALLCGLPPASASRAPKRRAASIFFFACALFSKPVAAYVVAALAAFRLLLAPRDERPSLRALGRELMPHLALTGLAAIVAIYRQMQVGALRAHEAALTYLRNLWYALGFHIDLVMLLREPCAKYLPDPFPPPFDPLVDLAPLVFVALCALGYRHLGRGQRPAAACGLAFALFAYLPSSNLLPLVRFVADSYVYAPLVGLGFFVGALFDGWLERLGAAARIPRVAIPGAAALLLGMLAMVSSARFADSVTLWSDVYARYPNDYRVCQNLAVSYYDVAGPAEALAATDRCIARFGPERFEKNRGIALFRLGRLAEAEAWFARSAERRRAAGAGVDPVTAYYQARIGASGGDITPASAASAADTANREPPDDR